VLSRIDLAQGVVSSGAGGPLIRVAPGVKMQLVQSSKEMRSDGGGIRFLPDGRSSGGVLTLSGRQTAYRISVNWLTAGVVIAAVEAGAR
jgi:general secretion pathway protein H